MKKLVLFIIILIPFVCFAKQKVNLFENVDNELFQIEKHFLLDIYGEPEYGFMITGLEGWDIGISFYSQNDSIIQRCYSNSKLIDYNIARNNGENPKNPVLTYEYKQKIDKPEDFSAITQFLQTIVDKAKPCKEKEHIVDGVNWFVLAKGKWAYIHTEGYNKVGAITDILEIIALAFENNDPSMLTREYLGLE